jgi:hypothetical protein
MPEGEQYLMTEEEWSRIIERIRAYKCLPIIGPGVCGNYYPPKAKMADTWAKSLKHQLEERNELARVAQLFEAQQGDRVSSRERLIEEFKQPNGKPDPNDKYEPHRVLAYLPFKIYITTNYDDYMTQALTDNKNKDPRQEYCKWRGGSRGVQKKSQKVSVANPLVFHLYGHIGEIESLVLIEKDYMQFLLSVAKDDKLIPTAVTDAIGSLPSLLFIGYQLDDWDFRILLTVLDSFFPKTLKQGRRHISVQLASSDANTSLQQIERARQYFAFEDLQVDVYWGTCEQFAKELLDRYQKSEMR